MSEASSQSREFLPSSSPDDGSQPNVSFESENTFQSLVISGKSPTQFNSMSPEHSHQLLPNDTVEAAPLEKAPNFLIVDIVKPNSETPSITIKKNKYHDYIFSNNFDNCSKIQTIDFIQSENAKYDKSMYITVQQIPKSDHSQQSESAPVSSDPPIVIQPENLSTKNITEEVALPPTTFTSPVQSLFLQVHQQLLKDQINTANSFKTTLLSSKPKSRQNFTERQRTILNGYLQRHSANPYASSNDVDQLVKLTGLQPKQIRTYFTNKRMRDAKCMNLLTSRRGHHI